MAFRWACRCLREVCTGMRIWTYRNVVVDTRGGGKKGGDVGVDWFEASRCSPTRIGFRKMNGRDPYLFIHCVGVRSKPSHLPSWLWACLTRALLIYNTLTAHHIYVTFSQGFPNAARESSCTWIRCQYRPRNPMTFGLELSSWLAFFTNRRPTVNSPHKLGHHEHGSALTPQL